MTKCRSMFTLMLTSGVAAVCLVAAGCTTASVGSCKEGEPDRGTGSLSVRVFDDSSDARHGRPTARSVTSTLTRKDVTEDGPVATSEEAVWSTSELPPGKYALRISVGDESGKGKTVIQRFWIDAGRGKVVKVVLSNESAAVRRTLVSVACVALAVVAIEELLPSPLEGMFEGTQF